MVQELSISRDLDPKTGATRNPPTHTINKKSVDSSLWDRFACIPAQFINKILIS